ncbi:hypothetical protein [Streptococcus ferus]|uniref:hypothetical protein n=1 Tax=Streptococcus ferus TaxID=1345 RepID=UPI00359FD44E
MNFNDGIIYVFMTLLTFTVNTIINVLTDVAEMGTLNQKRVKKHGIVSLLIVMLYFTYYYFTTNQTSVFVLSEEDKILLLLILVFSFLYLNLNATISTVLNKFILKIGIEGGKDLLCFGMIIVNLVIAFLVICASSIFLSENNIITKEFDGEILYNSNRYNITVPKNTIFYYDNKKTSQTNESTGINEILKPSNTSSEYLLRKNTEIILKQDSYVRYNNATVKNFNDGKTAKIDFYLTENSVQQLKKDVRVRLKTDTTVLLSRTNSITTILNFNTCILAFGLIIYYIWKLCIRKLCSVLKGRRP